MTFEWMDSKEQCRSCGMTTRFQLNPVASRSLTLRNTSCSNCGEMLLKDGEDYQKENALVASSGSFGSSPNLTTDHLYGALRTMSEKGWSIKGVENMESQSRFSIIAELQNKKQQTRKEIQDLDESVVNREFAAKRAAEDLVQYKKNVETKVKSLNQNITDLDEALEQIQKISETEGKKKDK